MNLPPFTPHPLARNRHLQTVLSSLKKPPITQMATVAQKIIFDLPVDDGAKLLGYYSPQPDKSKGLILLIHGWLGSVESTYMLAHGGHLYEQGYAIFRLNLRDHGGTVALNREAYHGCRLEEVFQTARQVAALEPDSPFYIAGFSLGGNFALRLAWRHSEDSIANLRHVVAVSPAVKPRGALFTIDSNPIYHRYFLRKWKRTLQAKQAAFPQDYGFVPKLLACESSDELGELAIDYLDGYDSASYYRCYGVHPTQMAQLTVETTIITAADDPIIEVSDFEPFHNISPYMSILIQPYGGHVGFVHLFPYRHWLGAAIETVIGD